MHILNLQYFFSSSFLMIRQVSLHSTLKLFKKKREKETQNTHTPPIRKTATNVSINMQSKNTILSIHFFSERNHFVFQHDVIKHSDETQWQYKRQNEKREGTKRKKKQENKTKLWFADWKKKKHFISGECLDRQKCVCRCDWRNSSELVSRPENITKKKSKKKMILIVKLFNCSFVCEWF